MMRKSTAQDALSCALRILALREHTAFELAQKLRQRNFDEDEIADTLAQCQTWNYLNDSRAAEALVRTLLKKGAGLNKIKFELAKRRVPDSITAALVLELEEDDNQLATALALTTKKFVKAQTSSEIHQQKGKIFRYLQNKGYPTEIIYQVFQSFYQN